MTKDIKKDCMYTLRASDMPLCIYYKTYRCFLFVFQVLFSTISVEYENWVETH